MKPNLPGNWDGVGGVHFLCPIVMPQLLKLDIILIDHYCFILSQNALLFKLQLH